MSGRDQRPEHAQGGDMLIRCVGCRAERVIGPGWVNLPACRDCGGPMLPLDLEAAAYGGAGSKRVPSTSKDLESGRAGGHR